MVSKPTEKMMEALTQLIEGFLELQEAVESDIGSFATEDEEIEETDSEEELETVIINQVRLAVDSVIEAEDYSPSDFAALISALTEGLEEIDPSVFEDDGEEEEEYGDAYEDEDDYDLDDDLDEEFDDDDEFEDD